MTRRITGARVVPLRKKKLTEASGKPRHTNFGKQKQKVMKGRGSTFKTVLLSANVALVLNPKTKKAQKSKIKSVIKSPSNRYFKTQMVKGTLIETELGKAKITNRPGQEGAIAAILVD